jgi:hypothetical protein
VENGKTKQLIALKGIHTTRKTLIIIEEADVVENVERWQQSSAMND